MKLKKIIQVPPKILIYSGPGTGKTALTLTLGSNLQILDLDGGLSTGLYLDDKFKKDRLEVDAIQILEQRPHLQATVFSRTKSKIIEIANDCAKHQYEYEVLALDSITALSNAALQSVMASSGDLHGKPQIQHWGLAIDEVKQVMAILASLPIVVVVIGHEQFKTLGKGTSQEDKIYLGIFGKNLPLQLPGYFDEFWRMRVLAAPGGKFSYKIQTYATPIAEAKSRSCLPNMTDSSCGMWELLKKIGYEKKGTHNAPLRKI